MKRSGSILFLFLLAAGVYFGARWYRYRNDLHATVIFRSAVGLEKGSEVVAAENVIGSVTGLSKLDTRDAVSIAVRNDHRNEILTDSLFSVEKRNGRDALVVVNGAAVGRPVADNAVLEARDDKFARWVANGTEKLAPYVAKLKDQAAKWKTKYDATDVDQALTEWKEKFPEWKREGGESIDRNLAAAKRQVDAMEKRLRDAKKDGDADRLRKKFDEWVRSVKNDS